MSNIEITGLNHFYGKVQALYDINCKFKENDVIVLLGHSGAGKSTLLRALNLLEIPSSGSLQIAGQTFDFSKKVSNADTLALRRKVGMVFQQYNLWPHLTVEENLTYVPTTLGFLSKDQAKQKAQEYLTRLHIADFAQKYPLQLSGGQQQRVAICRALMMAPEVLLYDEPTAALDPSITMQVSNIINEFRGQHMTQIVVTHDVGFAKTIADYVVFFHNGRVLEQGPAEKLFNHPETEVFAEYLKSVN